MLCTDRSRAILLWWFLLCYILVLIFVLLAPYVKVRVDNDQENAQFERNFHSKNRVGKLGTHT